ncbi:hypothetical protein ACH41H_34585 [Streptomyces sp. NPDC020800]|uniref:hypothetical protein n=1 Tax=Streptomyces sp. NPDC020800 TaxID=3365092 RepID=UPI0037B2E6DD
MIEDDLAGDQRRAGIGVHRSRRRFDHQLGDLAEVAQPAALCAAQHEPLYTVALGGDEGRPRAAVHRGPQGGHRGGQFLFGLRREPEPYETSASAHACLRGRTVPGPSRDGTARRWHGRGGRLGA